MPKLAAFVLSLSLASGCLAGCGSSSSSAWVKPGATEEQRGRDTLECLTHARRMVSGGSMGPHEGVDQDRYRRCMMDRGYTAPPPK